MQAVWQTLSAVWRVPWSARAGDCPPDWPRSLVLRLVKRGSSPVSGHDIVRKTCRLDGRKSRSGFRPCTRPEQAISCYNPVQVHGPRREWKRKADHEVLFESLCTIKPGTLRPACTSVMLSTLQNAACQVHTLWLRPAVVTTDSIHIRRCEAAAIVDVRSPRRERRVMEACETSKDTVQETQIFHSQSEWRRVTCSTACCSVGDFARYSRPSQGW